MKVSMYSLMLSDEIISEIDKLSKTRNTNRSSLINEILADYLDLKTPQKRINNIYQIIDSFLSDNNSFDSLLELNNPTMSIKSILTYKYNPSIKYDVQIFKNFLDSQMGELRIALRSKSKILLEQLHNFFNIFLRLEIKYLSNYFNISIINDIKNNNKFIRTLNLDHCVNYDENDIANLITRYIKSLDYMINKYINLEYFTLDDIENEYTQLFIENNLII